MKFDRVARNQATELGFPIGPGGLDVFAARRHEFRQM
jgi:hypothetical protein